MRLLLTFVGVLLISLGVAGLAVSGAATVWVWSVRDPWTEEGGRQLEAVEHGLAQVHDISSKSKVVIRKVKTKLNELEQVVDQVRAELQSKGPLETVIVAGVERDLAELFTEAEDWIRSLQQSAETAHTSLLLFSAIPLSGTDESDDQRADGLRLAVSELSEVSRYLEKLAEWIGELRKSKNLEANAARLGRLLVEMDSRLLRIEKEIREFDDKVEGWQNTARRLKRDLPGLLVLGAWLVTAALVWFGIAQLALILHGWRLWHGNARQNRRRWTTNAEVA